MHEMLYNGPFHNLKKIFPEHSIIVVFILVLRMSVHNNLFYNVCW